MSEGEHHIHIPHVLSIAGSDPSGGAGIQADLKTFSALGAYGMAAITGLTAQNTLGVRSVHSVPPDFLRTQIEAVFDDVRVDAVKIGMLGNAEIVKTVADVLEKYQPAHIVLDPVMVAQSGDRLVDDASMAALRDILIPMTSLVTPNIPEAEALLGLDYRGDMKEFARSIDAKAVYLKGGHIIEGGIARDVLVSGPLTEELKAEAVETENTHGTGCTLSSALAVYLGRGVPMVAAARSAKGYITQALQNADKLHVGAGAGPVHHFYQWWD